MAVFPDTLQALHVAFVVMYVTTELRCMNKYIDALETKITEEYHATKKQDLTHSDKELFKPSKMLAKFI